MLKSILTVAVALCTLLCHAQYTVKGVITDVKSNQALEGASVKIEPINQFTQSSPSGEFQFNVPAGHYRIIASYVGYLSKATTLEVSENMSVDLSLEAAAILSDEVVVSATRAGVKTPTTFTTIEKEQIQQQNFGQDVPYLLNWTPSVVTTSDAGTGIGYTGIRIRGSDATRINVTINGIPYNDSESLGTYWVDIPDIATSSQNIQIQRGVGTSTNGAGAFGASINLQTNVRNDDAYAEIINSAGSFKSHRHTVSFGSGLLNKYFVVEGRVSKIKSDGFIDRGTSDLGSYFFTGGFYGKNTLLKAVVFGGKERTYQAWYGVPESRLNGDAEAMLITAMNEGWNEEQTANLLNSGSRTFNPYTYKNQVDDYQQDHYQLHFSQNLSRSLTLNTSLHYTHGKGYYEEYKYNADFADYSVPDVTIGDSVVSSSDLIRRRWLDNDFYGVTYSLNYSRNKVDLIFGGGWNRYDGDHFGEIIWAEVSTVPTEHVYYLNNGDKRDFNTFAKVNFDVTESLNVFADLQYRRIDYTAEGVENDQQPIAIDATFNFINPKVGATYLVSDSQQFYASYAVANREPLREDFLSSPDKDPKHENLQNVEFGYRLTTNRFHLNANYYYMNYKNQFVLTGELNDTGAPLRANTGKSYRTGIELDGGIKLSDRWQVGANVTLSRNKIRKYVEFLEDYGDNFDTYEIVKNEFKNTDISFSPNIIAGSQLSYLPLEGLQISLLSKYVGKQYLDNTANEDRSISSYFVNDLRIAYKLKPSFADHITVSFLINNFLDEKYESNGYTWLVQLPTGKTIIIPRRAETSWRC